MGELLHCGHCFRLIRSAQLFSFSKLSTRLYTATKNSLNYYEVLGIKQNATAIEIKQAFVNLSKKLHPDKNPEMNNHDGFVRLNEAYSVLSKPLTRREYDTTLAHRLYAQQNLARNAGSHMSGSYPGPGSSGTHGTHASPEQDQRFWDETIWAMRDKNRDSFTADDEYYGIKGIRRLPNSIVLSGCALLAVILTVAHFYLGYRSSEKSIEKMNKKSKTSHAYWVEAKTRAKVHGNEKQLELISKKIKKDTERFFPQTTTEQQKSHKNAKQLEIISAKIKKDTERFIPPKPDTQLDYLSKERVQPAGK